MRQDTGGSPASIPENHQARFHRRWPALRDPHVRALAWLLYAPDLLAAEAPCWNGQIATLGPISPEVAGWLHDLQDDPALHAALLAHLAHNPSARLGRYAEKLLGFYLQQQGWLVAANLQVRNNQGGARETLGEFDFLVHPPESADDTTLVHWEFATKFYLLEPGAGGDADAFVGPNLADSLGRKMRKIMEQQLQLSLHPAAAAVLPAPVTRAGALVKGWLFYREGVPMALPASMGIAADHCRGFWCDTHGLRSAHQPEDRYLILARLAWLAPARAALAQGLTLDALLDKLEQGFQTDQSPVMVARCRIEAGGEAELIETDRGFIVPPQWEQRAAATVRHAVIRV
ncbi:MAG: DUF1853 family protein [Herbaspirillum sp.]|nr:DUF1853 family protein [Herbaspirillum sp.]